MEHIFSKGTYACANCTLLMTVSWGTHVMSSIDAFDAMGAFCIAGAILGATCFMGSIGIIGAMFIGAIFGAFGVMGAMFIGAKLSAFGVTGAIFIGAKFGAFGVIGAMFIGAKFGAFGVIGAMFIGAISGYLFMIILISLLLAVSHAYILFYETTIRW